MMKPLLVSSVRDEAFKWLLKLFYRKNL